MYAYNVVLVLQAIKTGAVALLQLFTATPDPQAVHKLGKTLFGEPLWIAFCEFESEHHCYLRDLVGLLHEEIAQEDPVLQVNLSRT